MRILCAAVLLVVAGCVGGQVPHGAPERPPGSDDGAIVAADGYRLPLHAWPAESDARAVVLALHGFNDHGGAFAVLAPELNASGIHLYAYDQRGFGATEHAGDWAGIDALTADLAGAIPVLRGRHPDLPLYLLGKSMGGAVAVLALSSADAPAIDGTVLVAPALSARDDVPVHQRFALRVLETVAPGLPLSVELGQAFGYRPSDQPEVMESLRADPLVLDYPRVVAVAGLTELMDSARHRVTAVPGPVLMLYGARDDLVPRHAMCGLLRELVQAGVQGWWVRIYPQGFHMLTRYSGAESTRADILRWIGAAVSARRSDVLAVEANDDTAAPFVVPAEAFGQLGCDES